jgi:hypothetical protein
MKDRGEKDWTCIYARATIRTVGSLKADGTGPEVLGQAPAEERVNRNAELVRRLIARAGVPEPGRPGDGTLATEPLLVFIEDRSYGRWRQGLDVFDQRGLAIGTVGRTNTKHREVGYRCRYEVCDSKVVAELRDTSKRCFGTDDYTFSVLAPDGSEIATARNAGGSYTFKQGDQRIATAWPASRVWVKLHRPSVRGAASLIEGLQRIYDRVNRATYLVEDHAEKLGAAVCSGPTWESQRMSQQMNAVILVPAGVGTEELTTRVAS